MPFRNDVLFKLADFVGQHPRIEKTLIVADRATGQHILQNLARTGTSWINFNVKIATSLAHELVEERFTVEGLRALSSLGSQAVIDSVFNALADAGSLKYFKKHPVNKGIVEALTRTVRELRLNGIMSNDLKKGCFIDPNKEADLRLILSEYEKTLEAQKLVDNARLFLMALEELRKDKAKGVCKYFILTRQYMRGIEREFVKNLCGDDLIVIDEDPAIGLHVPTDAWASDIASFEPVIGTTDIERLRWLFNSKDAPKAFKDGSIELFSAIGFRNEVREVMRRICGEGTTVDDVEIVYTDADSYPDLLYSLCEKLKIPVTFAEGQSIYMTATGRAMLGFLLWIKEDFNETYLRRIIGSSSLAFLLRTSKIGWGRDRYTVVLDGLILKSQEEAEDLRREGDVHGAERREAKAAELITLKTKCESLLKLVPVKGSDDKIDFGAFCAGCVAFLEQYAVKTESPDAEFVRTASDRIVMLGELIRGAMLFDEAMEKILIAVSGVRVGASGPKPGHLHVAHYCQGGRSGRDRTFIVGLDEGKFPAKAAQDPVLLDEERIKVSRGLEVSAERITKNIYDMASLIAGLRGKVTFSYSGYDIKADKKAFPSSMLLQVFRIKEGDPGADYEAMLTSMGEPVGFDESHGGKVVLDETDLWLACLNDDGVLKDAKGAVQDVYEGIQEGLTAKEKRASDTLTEYDGKVTPHGDDLDPREHTQRVMSCSRLESAAKCPFAYFVENVLNVRKPDEVEKDDGIWLNPADRGKLLHEVFQLFIDGMIKSKTKLSLDEEKRSIAKILDEAIIKFKVLQPPPSDIVFKNECVQLKRDVGVFLQINKELGTEPVGTEVAFGGNKGDPVKIPLGKNKFITLRGMIDRIDRVAPSQYHIWDYKTGGTFSYKENGYVSGGEQLQHALYAVAAEAILRANGEDKEAKVVAAGYLFPTEKGTKDGLGGVFSRSIGMKWVDTLDRLLDIISAGTFIVNNEDKCYFCDYTDICGGKTARDAMKAKLLNAENKALEGWTTLKGQE